MQLAEKIVQIYPELAAMPDWGLSGIIIIQDNSDGNGPYIKQWKYSKPQPTTEQLDNI